MKISIAFSKWTAGISELQIALLKLRALYLVSGLAGGMLAPYLTTLFIHQGFSGQQAGWSMAIGTFASVIVQPLWGMIVDRYRRTRLVLGLSLAVPAVLVFFYNTKVFAVAVLVYTVSTIFSATQPPIADSYAVATARAAGTSYGTIRSLASLGYALGGFAGGIYLSYFQITSLWVPYMILAFLGVLAVCTLPEQTDRYVVSMSFSEGLKKLARNKSFLVFLGGCFLVNQTLTAFNSFFVFAFQSIGGSFRLSGVALLIASITNVPAMLLAAFVIRKIGREKMLMLAAVAYILRWGIQWLFPVPAVMIGIQVLHGLSFGFFYIAAVEFVAATAGKEMQATGQSVFNMVFAGFAGIIGNLLNGYLIEAGGVPLMHLSCTVSAALGALLLCIVVADSRKAAVPSAGGNRSA
ncbi:MFS transporter [Paenibacillus beijingensis]|uniref:Maltose permease n=1 Tax=Paenibacillus beijingensis TaxID=1126833 RepID=A0A0D5NK26_9BACL|nr:MFS transporter [Paenibacillus beijingensis]AJY75694.1 maltose permease [Paenibacillus beijingensis]